MAKTADQIQGLLSTSGRRVRLARDEPVELHLDTGEVVDATIASLRSRSAAADRITARSKTWTRWAGTPDDLMAFVSKAYAEIAERSSETPPVSIRVGLSGNDEERYFDLATFEREMRSAESGAPGARLRDIQAIDIAIGPTHRGAFKAHATFSRGLPTPGVLLSLEGADRAVVSGLKEELAPLIDRGRPRIPALPGPVQMFVGGLAGFAYFVGLTSVNWDFMPDGWIGTILFVLLYLSGFIALIYAVTAGLRSLLPPLTLAQAGQKTPSQQWAPRIAKVGGALGLAAFPFLLERIFG